MRIQITSRHEDLPTSVRDRADQRLAKLARYEPRLSSVEVVFSSERHTKRAEAVLAVDGEPPMVAHGEGTEFSEALEQLTDRLSRKLRRRRAQAREHKGPDGAARASERR